MSEMNSNYEIKIMTDEGEEVHLGGPETEYDFERYSIEISQHGKLEAELSISKSMVDGHGFDIRGELEALVPGTEMYEYGSELSVEYGEEDQVAKILTPEVINTIAKKWEDSIG